MTAKLMRAKKLPSLKTLLKAKKGPRPPQSPEEQREIWLEIAEGLGMKVTRHEHPVI